MTRKKKRGKSGLTTIMLDTVSNVIEEDADTEFSMRFEPSVTGRPHAAVKATKVLAVLLPNSLNY